jgi:tRNA (guanine26-N2/guanine27-N2)-dimethyltransferase
LRYFQTIEGTTKLIVPLASVKDSIPPTFPVFFNPAAVTNRDVSVALAESEGGSTFCDSMAGVGARGLRIAHEVESVKAVTLVDINAVALGVARRSAVLNRVSEKCEFRNGDASSVLHSFYGSQEKFEFVDVDPFGTPVRQLPAAISATADGGILCVTATDTAALCGVYPKASLRRYGAAPLNNSFHHETGIRILVNAIRRLAGQVDIGISPVAAHSTRHYIRAFVRLFTGASKADASQKSEGYVAWCPSCGTVGSLDFIIEKCQGCGKKARVAGPLWLGRLVEDDLVERSAKTAARRGFMAASRILDSLAPIARFPPWSFSIEEICSSLHIATVPEDKVRHLLSEAGYESCRQPFEKTGLKTDAPYGAVEEAVRGSAMRISSVSSVEV